MSIIKYGFRFDPLEWIKMGDSVWQAQVRLMLGMDLSGRDRDLLKGRIVEILEKKAGDRGEGTAVLLDLLDLGCRPDSPEVRELVEGLLRHHRNETSATESSDQTDSAHAWKRAGILPDKAVQALCRAGCGYAPEVKSALRWFGNHPETWLGKPYGCPWEPNSITLSLWEGRGFGPVDDVIQLGFDWFSRELVEPGLLGHLDPWGFVEMLGRINHHTARELAIRLLPIVLRAQKPDGGWGEHSLAVFRMLRVHGLLNALLDLPPLPPDWRVLRSLPVPKGKVRNLAWDGHTVWVQAVDANEAVSISPENGAVTRSLPMPATDIWGIAWYEGQLVACQGGPWKPMKNLLFLDGSSGELRRKISLDKVSMAVGLSTYGDRLAIGDGYDFDAKICDPRHPEELHSLKWPGTCAGDLTETADGLWHTDSFASLMIKCNPIGKLVDWAELPFNGSIKGLTWDGAQLWGLDPDENRICTIERISKDG
jgi:hypothetical protein